MKKITNLIVGKDVATGNEGFLRLVRADGTTALGAGTYLTAGCQTIYVEQTLATVANKRLSKPIHGAYVSSVRAQAGAALTAQVSTITIVAAQASDDTTYTCYIVIKSEKDSFQIRKAYQFTSGTGATITTIMAGIGIAINADTNLPITATSSTGTLTLTSTSTDNFYFGTGFSCTATHATGTPFDQGVGTSAILDGLESLSQGYDGALNKVEYVDAFPSYVVSGTLYDTIAISSGMPVEISGEDDTEVSGEIVYVAGPTGAFGTGDNLVAVKTQLNAWAATIPNEQAAIVLA